MDVVRVLWYYMVDAALGRSDGFEYQEHVTQDPPYLM